MLLDRSYRTGLEIQLNRCAGFELFGVKFVNHEAVANGRAGWTNGADADWSVIREGIKKPAEAARFIGFYGIRKVTGVCSNFGNDQVYGFWLQQPETILA